MTAHLLAPALTTSTVVSVLALVAAGALLVAVSVLRELRVPRAGWSRRPGPLGLALGAAALVAVLATVVRLLAAVA